MVDINVVIGIGIITLIQGASRVSVRIAITAITVGIEATIIAGAITATEAMVITEPIIVTEATAITEVITIATSSISTRAIRPASILEPATRSGGRVSTRRDRATSEMLRHRAFVKASCVATTRVTASTRVMETEATAIGIPAAEAEASWALSWVDHNRSFASDSYLT
jgi:hypothetical protein